MNIERIRDYMRAYHIRKQYASLKKDRYIGSQLHQCLTRQAEYNQHMREIKELRRRGYMI